MNSRIYGEITNIDENEVKEFFEKRFCKENPLASVMVRSDPNDKIAEKRNTNEINRLRSIYDFSMLPRILDIGCGCGRWASNLKGSYSAYTGIDFCENYIHAANTLFADDPNTTFKSMATTELKGTTFPERFDLIIINGLCMYLNDPDLEQLLKTLPELADKRGTIYLRESVSTIGERLTLKDFPSEELKTLYNAVYRMPEEYETKFSILLKNFTISSQGFLTNPEIWKRKETDQKYWLLQK